MVAHYSDSLDEWTSSRLGRDPVSKKPNGIISWVIIAKVYHWPLMCIHTHTHTHILWGGGRKKKTYTYIHTYMMKAAVKQ